MMLIDSNLIIYAAQSEHGALRQWIADNSPSVSAVSYVEVLGFHRLTAEDIVRNSLQTTRLPKRTRSVSEGATCTSSTSHKALSLTLRVR